MPINRFDLTSQFGYQYPHPREMSESEQIFHRMQEEMHWLIRKVEEHDDILRAIKFEEQLRRNNATLNEAYEHYQMLKILVSPPK